MPRIRKQFNDIEYLVYIAMPEGSAPYGSEPLLLGAYRYEKVAERVAAKERVAFPDGIVTVVKKDLSAQEPEEVFNAPL